MVVINRNDINLVFRQLYHLERAVGEIIGRKNPSIKSHFNCLTSVRAGCISLMRLCPKAVVLTTKPRFSVMPENVARS